MLQFCSSIIIIEPYKPRPPPYHQTAHTSWPWPYLQQPWPERTEPRDSIEPYSSLSSRPGRLLSASVTRRSLSGCHDYADDGDVSRKTPPFLFRLPDCDVLTYCLLQSNDTFSWPTSLEVLWHAATVSCLFHQSCCMWYTCLHAVMCYNVLEDRSIRH